MRGRSVSLFDAFFDPTPNPSPQDAGSGVVAGVIRAVENLLNKRSFFAMSTCESLGRRTVLDYGMPDFLHLSPTRLSDMNLLTRSVREALIAHEPRLILHSVTLEMPRYHRDSFRVLITGEISTLPGILERVLFPVWVGKQMPLLETSSHN